MTIQIDQSQFIDDSDFSSPTELPYAQWVNPQSDAVGLGIKVAQGDIAGFTPDESWKKQTLNLGSDKEDVYLATEPRLVVLNGASIVDANIKGLANPLYMHNIPTGEKRLFDKDKYYANKENYTVYRPLIFFPVGKNNELLSSTPFVLNVKKASSRTLTDVYFKQWVDALLNVYREVGVQFPKGKRPTCSFLARNVFEPTIIKSTLQSANSSAKSQATICTGFKPIKFNNVAIPKDSESGKTIKEYMNFIIDLVAIKKKVVEEEIVEEIKQISVDDFTDPVTGEVDPAVLDNLPF
jgi:hypothetical protein